MIVRRILLVLFLLGCLLWLVGSAWSQAPAFPTAAPESQGVDSQALEQVAQAIEGYLQEDKLVGAELLIIKNRHTIFHRSFGWQDREAEVPMKVGTIFNIRSMTKPLTGMALQLLIDEGKAAIDDRIAEHLPAFDKEACRAITLEQALEHRAGFPLTVFRSSLDEYSNLQAIAEELARRGPRFEPGSKFWYSDAGTDVVGAVVERISGMPLDRFVRERLLKPLGMRDSFYVGDVSDPRWKRVASLYMNQGGSWAQIWKPEGEPMYPFAWGSQTLYSTPLDYARFLAMWMDRGVWDGKRLLSEAAMARVLEPASRMAMMGTDTLAPSGFTNLERWYGQMSVLQCREESLQDSSPVILGHSGSDGTIAWAWPARDLMVLYFTQSRGGTTVLRLEHELDKHLIDPAAHRLDPGTRARFAPFLGTYLANFGPFRNEEFTVLVQGRSLALDIPSQIVFELEETGGEEEWRFELDPRVIIGFVKNEAGEVTALKFTQGANSFELPRGQAAPEPQLDPAFYQKYLGIYWDEEQQVEVHMELHNGYLAARRADIPFPIEFRPPDTEGIWVGRKNASVRIRFNLDTEGKVLSYSALIPGGEIKRKRLP